MSNFMNVVKIKTIKRIENTPDFPYLKKNMLDFCQIFTNRKSPAIIAEIKYASPSYGRIYPGTLDPVSIAKQYLAYGASALSVLTEPDYFSGDINFIRSIRVALPQAHILLKDFVCSKKQIDQGLVYGANAVLLIVAFLEKSLLIDLYQYANSLGLTPIIEVHNENELEIALSLYPKVIGINNRNLKTLQIDLDIARSLIPFIPQSIHTICESGLKTIHDLNHMSALEFQGFLIGSHFMQHHNPGLALKSMLQEASYAS